MTDKEISNRPILTLNKAKKANKPIQDNAILSLDKKEQSNETEKEKKVENNKKKDENQNKENNKDKDKKSKNPPAAPDYDFNAIYNELHSKFPKIINMKKPVLLAISIRKVMLREISNIPNHILYKWISWYFRKSNYYAIHEVGAMRYNLDGTEAGIVTEKDQAKRDKQLGKNQNNNLSPEDLTQEKVISPTQRPKE
jgi:hypothetical protein